MARFAQLGDFDLKVPCALKSTMCGTSLCCSQSLWFDEAVKVQHWPSFAGDVVTRTIL